MKYRQICFFLCALIVVLGIGWPHGTAIAADAGEIQLIAQPFFNGKYRAGNWFPIRVTVANSGPDVTAVVSVQGGATYETTLELPRGANKSVILYVQPATFRRNATARVMIGGVEAAKAEVPLTWLGAQVQVVGVLMEQPLALAMPSTKPQQSKIETITLSRADLPERVEALSMFDVLLVDGAPLVDLNVEQQQALADWVRIGGQLVLGGAKLDTTLTQLPETLRIATVGEAAPLGPISLLPELADAAPPATRLIATDGAFTIATADADTVGVQRTIGTGRVTTLGFSLAASELSKLPADPAIWTRIAELQPSVPDMGGMGPGVDIQSQMLGGALMTLPVLDLPPMGLLVGILAAYLLVVGPGMYLLLRRLDRQAWGWVAIPLVTLVFSLGAYGYGFRLRGNDIILNQISVMEPLGDRSRVRTFGGLFSPGTQTYQIMSPSDALFKPLATGDPGMPASTSNGTYVQGNGGVTNLQVAQWAMGTFSAEEMINGAPLEATITLSGDVLRGSVHNTGNSAIQDLALVQNMRIEKIGTLQPGESRDIELALNGPSVGAHESMAVLLLRDKWNFNQPIQPPATIRMQTNVLDAMFNTPYGRDATPMLLGWMDRAPIGLNVDQDRVQHQQLTLISMPLKVEYASGERIVLPRGWLKPTYESAMQSGGPCMSQFGSGWFAETTALTSTIQLPAELQSLRVDKATLYTQLEGPPMPAGLKFDLYDWKAGTWIQRDNIPNQLVLDEPDRFLSPTDGLKVRLNWQESGLMGKGGGCLTTGLQIEGTQP